MGGGEPVRLMIIGAGNRGSTYSTYALDEPTRAKVVAIIDPNIKRLQKLSHQHNVCNNCQYTKHPDQNDIIWTQVDAVIVATPDATHCTIVLQLINEFGQKHILVEKPMCTNEKDCRAIVNAAETNGVHVSVCHVLRYTPFNLEVKRIITAGELGTVLSIQHTEPIGYYHFAHSYVRGNWRREDESSFSLLTKSCHDIDLIAFWMEDETGGQVKSISSFGSLRYFRKENKPKEAGDTTTRCLDCPFESKCHYSAKRIYLDAVSQRDVKGWPVSVLVDGEVTTESVEKALKNGPYGKCVYECDNDVCDNQVVNMQFENGSTASFTMIATTEQLCTRQTKIYGSKAELTADAKRGEIRVFDFVTNTERIIHPKAIAEDETTSLHGHGGADFHLMHSFIRSVAEDDPSLISTNAEESLKTHALVFKAEQSRVCNSSLSW